MIGQRIGSYTIVEKLGEGGMGVVYRATDSRLHRDVALKFIPEAMAKDPQIMGRFEREAQVLASLNHPNIASIYGLEENGGQRALVMELAHGEELATRITRGKLSLEEALRIALAIAEALEAAHDKGIIHRDLKPANIKLGAPGDSGGGRLKILDFGLAKALQGELGTASGIDLTRSPTLSVAATQAGMILGTASYMSPEQARALPADRRADIWSFGVILFEMLAGQRAFRGDTVADTVAKVIERDPNFSALPPTVPPKVRELIERCLVKSPRQRLQAIGDARLVLEEALASLQRPLSVDAPAPAAPAPVTSERARGGAGRWLAVLLGAVVGAALAWAAASALRPRPQALVEPPLTVGIVVGDDNLFNELGASFALTPDGNTLAYVESGASERKLFVRRLDQLQATQITIDEVRTTGPLHPFVSPDGNWIGYALTNELRKVPVTGGASLVVCKVTRGRGATWLADDTIVFTPSPVSGLFRVPAAGGEPQPLTTLDEKRDEVTHRWPQALPDGKHVLFTSQAQRPNFDTATLEVVSIATGERKVVYQGGSYGRYAPSGHLLFVNRSTLFAIPFDLGSLETRGAAVPVLQRIAISPSEGGAQYDFSATGRLVYAAQGTEVVYPISWVDRDGRGTPLLEERQVYANPRLSPDGTRLALTELRDENWDIWVHDLERGVSTRLTFDEGVETEQIWSPDGEHLVFSSDRDGPDSLYRKRADGSGETERLTEARFAQWASSWSRDGRYLSYVENQTQYDLGTLDLETRETKPFLSTQFGESYGAISPNGRYLAYSSNESGVYKIYVRPFPGGEGKWQVSDGPGGLPRWRADGRELFWRNDEGVAVAAVETDGPTFRAGRATQLFSGAWRGGLLGITARGLSFSDYDVAPDGQRFLMFPGAESGTRSDHQHLTLLTRFFDQLKPIEGASK